MVNESYWSYKAASPTPSYQEACSLGFNGTEQQWNSLSPGMRREIVRSYKNNLKII